MTPLILRDDDLNFFSKVDDIETVYSNIPYFPISFAVVPRVLDLSSVGACSDTRDNKTPMPIHENPEIVRYIKKRLKDGRADVLLHGQTHGYFFPNGKRTPEMMLDTPTIGSSWDEVLGEEKAYLEDLFDYKISCFVAPSNIISQKNLYSAVKNGMHFSGIIPPTFERNITFRNILNYLKRMSLRLTNGYPYPGVLTYSDHKELNAVTTTRGYDFLMKLFLYCKRHNMPMAVNTHYWALRDKPVEREMLFRFVKDAIAQGAVPSKLSDCLK